jgi:two-component system chemotaxis response regulator CheY
MLRQKKCTESYGLTEGEGESENMKRVLVVDDAAFMRMAIKNILQKNNYEVVGEAENGLEGVKKYLELKPDLVTMDITMPEMTGLDALKQIKKIDSGAKVVMVSAMGQESMVRDSIIHGAKSFIVKPFKEEHVVQTVSKILEL